MLRSMLVVAAIAAAPLSESVSVPRADDAPIDMIVCVEVPAECQCPADRDTSTHDMALNCRINGIVPVNCVTIWFTDGAVGMDQNGRCDESDSDQHEPLCVWGTKQCGFVDTNVHVMFRDVVECDERANCCAGAASVFRPDGTLHARVDLGDSTVYSVQPAPMNCGGAEACYTVSVRCGARVLGQARIHTECDPCARAGG